MGGAQQRYLTNAYLEETMHDTEYDAGEPELHSTFVDLLSCGRCQVIEFDGIGLHSS